MNLTKKILAFFMALICILSFAACTAENEGKETDAQSSTDLALEDGEDLGVEQKKIKVANLSGKDAVQMLMRLNGSDEWGLNILSQEYFHTNKAVEVTYTVKETSVYDFRLVFEDGSYQDYIGYDLAQAKEYIYLDATQPEPESESATA